MPPTHPAHGRRAMRARSIHLHSLRKSKRMQTLHMLSRFNTKKRSDDSQTPTMGAPKVQQILGLAQAPLLLIDDNVNRMDIVHRPTSKVVPRGTMTQKMDRPHLTNRQPRARYIPVRHPHNGALLFWILPREVSIQEIGMAGMQIPAGIRTHAGRGKGTGTA